MNGFWALILLIKEFLDLIKIAINKAQANAIKEEFKELDKEGEPTTSTYNGLSERPSKKRNGSVAD